MTQYSFVTIWRVQAPIDKVWDAIINAEQWPQWWKSVGRVETLEPGNMQGIGRVERITWKTPLLYSLTFTARVVGIEWKKSLKVESTGELEGNGVWNLTQQSSTTVVHYDWNVRT